jgi:hypothetical protein
LISYTNGCAFLIYIYCHFSFSHFRGNVDAQGRVKIAQKLLNLQVPVTLRYGRSRSYHAPVPHPHPRGRKVGSFAKICSRFRDYRYGQTNVPCACTTSMMKLLISVRKPVCLATINIGGYDHIVRLYRVDRLRPKAAAPGTGGMRPCRAPVPRVERHKHAGKR